MLKVPRARARDRDEDDQHLPLRGEEDLALQVRHQARLQEDHVERVQVKTTSPHLCHVLECNDVDTLLNVHI